MRKEPFSIGNFVHLVRRGGRGLPIVKNESDRLRFLKVQYYLNDTHAKENWFRELDEVNKGSIFSWPESWPERNPLCSLCAYTLLNNHLHLIAFEKRENGISKFMHKSGISMTKHHNEKYRERGSLFQGSYKARVIDSDKYLRWVVPYVMVKNTFEMHPRGYTYAASHFYEAWEWAITYPFSSLGDYAGERNSPIIDSVPLGDIFENKKEFKELCKDMIMGRGDIKQGAMRDILME